MSDIDKFRAAEAERLAKEAAARRRWEQEDLRKLRQNIRDDDFLPDEWLEEAEEYMRGRAGGS